MEIYTPNSSNMNKDEQPYFDQYFEQMSQEMDKQDSTMELTVQGITDDLQELQINSLGFYANQALSNEHTERTLSSMFGSINLIQKITQNLG